MMLNSALFASVDFNIDRNRCSTLIETRILYVIKISLLRSSSNFFYHWRKLTNTYNWTLKKIKKYYIYFIII